MVLQGKNIIVTGGGEGIGQALVKKLLDEGAVIGVFDKELEGLELLKEKYSSLYAIECNVTNYQQVVTAVDSFYQKFEKIDVLVNNAGILYSAPLVSLSPEGLKKHDVDMWEKVITTDLNAIFYMTVNVVEKMIQHRTKGLIVNISSVAASGNAGQSAYSAAKAGVNALTRTWAKELGLFGIRVVGVAPGYTDTESTRKVMKEEVLKDVIKKVPLRRLGKIDEIADGILSVMKNDFFHGKILEIDGGLIV
jgi:3-oxoacyl-[acyl-carrier protein] reductase